MVFEKIPRSVSRSQFQEIFSGTNITKDNIATLVEKTPTGEFVYRLKFRDESLTELTAILNADYIESAYLDLAVLAIGITEANKTTRGLGPPEKEKAIMPWKQLIESPLPETGDRSIEGLKLNWALPGITATLTLTWTWPGQLCLEYIEKS